MDLITDTAASPPSIINNDNNDEGKEFMLFGVRVVVDSMRKSVSMNNLSQYRQPQELVKNDNQIYNKKDDVVAGGYASADDVVHHVSGVNRERKRGIPWTEDEHKLFLLGLQKVGKGDWRGISRNFVKTRTPTQVASHAQKYFLRRANLNRRRRRSSLFDITTDMVTTMQVEEQPRQEQNTSLSHSLSPKSNYVTGFSLSVNTNTVAGTQMENLTQGQTTQTYSNEVEDPMSLFPLSLQPADYPNPNNSKSTNLDPMSLFPLSLQPADYPNPNNSKSTNFDSSSLSLKLSLGSSYMETSAYQGGSSFDNGDKSSIISVA